jgi:hypothetical protein
MWLVGSYAAREMFLNFLPVERGEISTLRSSTKVVERFWHIACEILKVSKKVGGDHDKIATAALIVTRSASR